MDDEDLGDHIHGQTIQTKEGYDTLGENYTQSIQQQMSSEIFGGILPSELIIAPKSSIGYKLLRELGWTERNRKSINFNIDNEKEESDDSIDFDKIEGLDVSDFVEENLVSVHASEQNESTSTQKHKRDLKIASKINKPKAPKTKTKHVDHDDYYKGQMSFKDNKYGVGYIPTSVDFEFAKLKKEAFDIEKKNNRITMGQLNYDGLIYQEDDKNVYEYENIDNLALEKPVYDRREEK